MFEIKPDTQTHLGFTSISVLVMNSLSHPSPRLASLPTSSSQRFNLVRLSISPILLTTELRWHWSSTSSSCWSGFRPHGSRFSLMVPLNRKGSWGIMASLDLQGAPPQHTTRVHYYPVFCVNTILNFNATPWKILIILFQTLIRQQTHHHFPHTWAEPGPRCWCPARPGESDPGPAPPYGTGPGTGWTCRSPYVPRCPPSLRVAPPCSPRPERWGDRLCRPEPRNGTPAGPGRATPAAADDDSREEEVKQVKEQKRQDAS